MASDIVLTDDSLYSGPIQSAYGLEDRRLGFLESILSNQPSSLSDVGSGHRADDAVSLPLALGRPDPFFGRLSIRQTISSYYLIPI